MRNIRLIILASFSFVLYSCATIFNSKITPIKIITSKPSSLVVNNDTLRYSKTSKSRSLSFDRDNQPITITAFTDSLSKTVNVKAKNSFAYWLNFYPTFPFWMGFVIDTKTKKRYTYPKTVYIDFASPDSSYLMYKPLDKPLIEYTNILKITPLKVIDLSNPSIELGYERRTGDKLSTQLTASYLLPKVYWDTNHLNIKGFQLAIEEKYYLQNSAPFGPYVGLEFSFLKNSFRDIAHFKIKDIAPPPNDYDFYSDSIGVKKQTYSFNLKLGYQFIIKKISLDIYAGLGIRYKDVRHTDRINPNDEMYQAGHPNINDYYIMEGKYWTASVPLNLRIGWVF